MVSALDYLGTAGSLITELREHEQANISQAAGWIADSMQADGILHVFGSGHSALPGKDIYIRAGSLSNVRAIAPDEELDRFERIPGVAEALLDGYDMRAGEVMIVISNSGINPLPIEVAQIAGSSGLKTVGLTSITHSKKGTPRHSSGQKLYQVVDLAIDTHVPYGDASLEVQGLPMRIGPLSTLSGLLLMHSIVVETTGMLLERGIEPPVRISRNTPEGDEHNQRFRLQYGARIPEL
jgi:uncharacterized phosphosugar-binding protein